MQQCGFCSMVSNFFRRALCIKSRRESSESYYLELEDQDNLRNDEQSVVSEENVVIVHVQPRRQRLEPKDLEDTAKRLVSSERFHSMRMRHKKKLSTRSLTKDTALLDDLMPGQVQCVLQQSASWKFNIFLLENVSGGRSLPVFCIHLLHTYDLITHFKMDLIKAWKLFSMIEKGYHNSNPYHNSLHAVDVTQAMHCFLQQPKIREHMKPIEILAALLAAVTHDLDHPGVNQSFLIATSHHLAALYRNVSVLENHHWRSAVSCLIESELLDRDVTLKLQHYLSSLILATDITRQKDYLNLFKAYLDSDSLDLRRSTHRHLVLQIALKCADISNPCRRWKMSRKWSLKVCEEFFRQGDRERELNLPVTANCDRHTTSIPTIQIGFLKCVAMPLIKEWHTFLGNDLSVEMLGNLIFNLAKWEYLLAQETSDQAITNISNFVKVNDDTEFYSSTNRLDSSDPLLPLRKSSLSPLKPPEQVRRVSVPLSVFQDSQFNKSRTESLADSQNESIAYAGGSEESFCSQFSVHDHCDNNDAKVNDLSTASLLPESFMATNTTPRRTDRTYTVIKNGSRRQQASTPKALSGQAQSPLFRPLFTSAEDITSSTKHHERLDNNEYKFSEENETFEQYEEKENIKMFENIKSMPADDLDDPKEKRMREVASAISQDLAQRRRGSAPVPISVYELPESSFGSITRPCQATRPKTVLKDGNGWKLVRQQTFPPMELSDQAQALLYRPLFTSAEDTTSNTKHHERLDKKEYKFNEENMTFEQYEEKENINTFENIKSMPANDLYAPEEKRMCEDASAIPELFRHVYGQDLFKRRRGSAPVPISVSELPELVAAARNGSVLSKPQPISCHQWMNSMELPHVTRRSSLPVEESHRVELSSLDNSV